MKNRSWILFDSDGVLVDTEDAFYRATLTTLLNYGIKLCDELYDTLYVKEGKSILEYYIKDKFDLASAYSERAKIYHDKIFYSDCSYPGTKDLLKKLLPHYNLGVVTGASSGVVDRLYKVAGIDNFFKFVITADDISRPKPDPESYLLAHLKYAVPLDNTVAIEDSHRGMLSAEAAGFKCIMVKNSARALAVEARHKVYQTTIEAGDHLLSQASIHEA